MLGQEGTKGPSAAQEGQMVAIFLLCSRTKWP